MKHKLFTFFIALVASAGTVFAQSSGTCGKDGDNLTWTLSGGTLTISGTGAMADWTTFPDIPWYSNRSSIKSVVIEDGVTSIGENAFAYCTNLTSVSLPNSVTSMEWCAFSDCTALTSFTISKSVKYIQGGALLGCTGLTSIIVESGNTTYDSRDNCNAIIETATNTLIQGCKNTIIPYSVTSIGSNAFRDYTNLTSIDIPYSVTSIGYGAFENCSGLTSITCEATTPPTCGGNCFYGVDKSIPVYVPEGKGKAYGDADGWSEFTNIKDGILASGTCGADGDNLTWKLSETKQLTISGTGAMADYSNTNPWYDNRSSIKSVVIEAGVTSIGKYAFYNCDNLTSVTIPGSVTSIGNYAFNLCSSLASVTIPEGVVSIGPRAFQKCTSLTSIALPEGITSIGIRTFYQCTSLKSVTIPASVANIIDEAFSGCNALTEITCKATTPPTCASNSFYAVTKSIPVYVPNVDAYTAASVWSSFTNIQEIPLASGTCGKNGDNLTWRFYESGKLVISGTGAMADWDSDSDVPWYSNQESVKSVVIEDGVTSIGNNAFKWSYSMTSVTISNTVTRIGEDACSSCKSLTSVTIPGNVKEIGNSAFWNCKSLASVTIENGVESIGRQAFSACDALTSVTIPQSVNNIETISFSDCSGLVSIVVASGNTTYDSRDNCNAIIETASNKLIVGCNGTIIPNTVTVIGSQAFDGCDGLTSITIPNSVETIYGYAFDGCSGLTSIVIPASVTHIETHVLGECSSLTSIQVENGNMNYDSRNNCNAIIETTSNALLAGCQNTIIPDDITTIRSSAFAGHTGLTSITIPAGVTVLGSAAFDGCTGLTSITCLATTPPTCYYFTFRGVDKTIPLYVPKGTVADYKAADGWKDFGDNIQEVGGGATGIETIDNGQLTTDIQKVIRDGKIYIIRDGKTYSVTGQEVK